MKYAEVLAHALMVKVTEPRRKDDLKKITCGSQDRYFVVNPLRRFQELVGSNATWLTLGQRLMAF